MDSKMEADQTEFRPTEKIEDDSIPFGKDKDFLAGFKMLTVSGNNIKNSDSNNDKLTFIRKTKTFYLNRMLSTVHDENKLLSLQKNEVENNNLDIENNNITNDDFFLLEFLNSVLQSKSTESSVIVETVNKDTTLNESIEQPQYPKSFQEICELVAQGKPIPGMRIIPNTVLDPSIASESTLKPRKKLWEV